MVAMQRCIRALLSLLTPAELALYRANQRKHMGFRKVQDRCKVYVRGRRRGRRSG